MTQAGPPPFQRLIDEHGAALWRHLRAMVGAQDAEDCFQETLLAALRAYPRVNGGDQLGSWLLTIGHNKAIDQLRARRTRPLGELPERPVADPDRSIWSVVAALPPKQRGAVLLRFAGDMAHRDIAGVLGCSEAAARRSLHEGLGALREAL